MKKTQAIVPLVVSFLFLAGIFLLGSPVSAGQPVPAITINGGEGQVVVSPEILIQVAVSLNPSSNVGDDADWWLAAANASGLFFYSFTSGWTTELAPTFQGPLIELPTLPVLTLSGLPAGTHTLYFGVDLTMNGRLDEDIHYDSITVKVKNWDCPDKPLDSLAALSTDQQAFIASRGNPDLFTLGFISEELDESGRVVLMAQPRRLESWVYNQGQFSEVVFDNGHFVSETSRGAAQPLQSTELSPSQFTPCMGRAQIVAMMGEPDCTQTIFYGGQPPLTAGRKISYMRYNPTSATPATTVVLENGVLISVTAGYALVEENHTSNDLCANR